MLPQFFFHRPGRDDGFQSGLTDRGIRSRASRGEIEIYGCFSGQDTSQICDGPARPRRQNNPNPATRFLPFDPSG